MSPSNNIGALERVSNQLGGVINSIFDRLTSIGRSEGEGGSREFQVDVKRK